MERQGAVEAVTGAGGCHKGLLKASEPPVSSLNVSPHPASPALGHQSLLWEWTPAKNQVNSSTHCHGNKEEWLQGSCQGSQVASRGMLKLARAVTCTQGLPLIRGVKHFQVLGISVILCHQLLPTGIFYVSLFYFCKGKLLLERRDSTH